MRTKRDLLFGLIYIAMFVALMGHALACRDPHHDVPGTVRLTQDETIIEPVKIAERSGGEPFSVFRVCDLGNLIYFARVGWDGGASITVIEGGCPVSFEHRSSEVSR